MIELTKKEKTEANTIKERFNFIHSNMDEIKEEISSLLQKSDLLIKELEDLRKKEKEFISGLGEKYGPGRLDPLNLTYEN